MRKTNHGNGKRRPGRLITTTMVLLVTIMITGGGFALAKNHKKQQEAGMSGIVFFKTQQLQQLKDFYLDQVGCSLWMDQGDCLIFKFGNMLFGFCKRDKADLDALITFFYEDRAAVDRMYQKFKDKADSPPVENKKYPIYNFFARDPEGRAIEFQYFTNKIDWDFDRYN